MGGVNVMNRLFEWSHPRVKSKNKYWPMIMNALNMSVVALQKRNSPALILDTCEISISFIKTAIKSEIKQTVCRYCHSAGSKSNDGISYYRVSTTHGRYKVCQKKMLDICVRSIVRLYDSKRAFCSEHIISHHKSFFWTYCNSFEMQLF